MKWCCPLLYCIVRYFVGALVNEDVNSDWLNDKEGDIADNKVSINL